VTPELFGADEAGMPVLLIDGPIPADMRASCRTAVDSCPSSPSPSVAGSKEHLAKESSLTYTDERRN